MEPENKEMLESIIEDMMIKAKEHRDAWMYEKAAEVAIIGEARNIAKKYGISKPEYL